MKLSTVLLLPLLLLSALSLYSSEVEVITLGFGDIRFDHLNIEKIINIKNERGSSTKSVLYYQDGIKIEIFYRQDEGIKKTVLYRKTNKPSEIVYYNWSMKPRKAVFFSYKTRTKTVVLYSRNGDYKKVTESRL